MAALDFLLTLAALVVALVVLGWPLSTWMARTWTTDRDWRVERGAYRLLGVDPRGQQRWPSYFRGVLAISVLGVLLLYGLQRLQQALPWSLGLPAVPQGLAFNTAISFVTNTDWQSYSPEATLGYSVQVAGLATQNFLSAAIGIAVAVALVRGLASRTGGGTIGNVWVDLTRTIVRVLLPIAFVAAVVLLLTGAVQNVDGFRTVTTLTGGRATVPGGPFASQEAIKELGTNGGGTFNANSAHPFENPTPFSDLVENVLLLLIPFALPRTFGLMVGDRRQGRAVLVTMVALAIVCLIAMAAFETAGGGAATKAAGAAMEGKEQRFGILTSVLFATSTTLTSTGAVIAAHDSFTPLGGMVQMVDMMFGELAPGGAGSGLYGFLVIAVLAVFLAGLMIGRTPSYLGKQVGGREITFSILYLLTTPAVVLIGLGSTFALPAVSADVARTSVLNPGSHGFSEVLYAFTSAGNNNGSAFGGLTADTPWLDAALGSAMFLGRYVPIVFVLALAGSFAAQAPSHAGTSTAPAGRRARRGAAPAGRAPGGRGSAPSPDQRGVASRSAGVVLVAADEEEPPALEAADRDAGALSTSGPQFVLLTFGTIVVVSALTYFPVLALGPLAEGLS